MGKCPNCDSWETLVEEHVPARTRSSKGSAFPAADVVSLADVDMHVGRRIATQSAELDRVLGGGLVPGSVVLVAGDPGMGKSTLTLQVAAGVAQKGGTALYVTGEESLHQIRQRAERLGLDVSNILVASETSVERVAALVDQIRPALVIVDSIQTMTTGLLESSAGTVAQVRESTMLLSKTARTTATPTLLIGHVTKEGMVAGPKVLEHMVDAVMQFEGEGMYSYRLLRALKNRYGSTNEIGVFEMTGSGLREVPNPSEVLLSSHHDGEPGTAVVAVIEGTRPLLVEVQALVSPSGYNVPQRVSTGYDTKRLQLILAILERRGGLSIRQNDVFVNIAGGLRIEDPAIDLGMAMAIASSVYDRPLPPASVFVGELGLTGEIRNVSHLEQRIAESFRLGLRTVYAPGHDTGKHGVVLVQRLADIRTMIFG